MDEAEGFVVHAGVSVIFNCLTNSSIQFCLSIRGYFVTSELISMRGESIPPNDVQRGRFICLNNRMGQLEIALE